MRVYLAVSDSFERYTGVNFGRGIRKENVVFAMRFVVIYHEASGDIAGLNASMTFYVVRCG